MLDNLLSVTSSVNLIIVLVILGAVYVIRSYLHHPSDLPPMPCRPIPLVGHVLVFKKSLRDTMATWKNQLGDIFSFYIGSTLYISLNSYAILHDALVKKGELFSDRPTMLLHKLLPEYKYGIDGNSGQSWKKQRSVSMTILRRFGMGKNWLAQKISEEIECYIKALEDFEGQPKNLELLTNTAVSNVICAILVGKRFDYNDPFLTNFVKESSELMKLFGKMGTINAFPWLRFLPGDKFHAKSLVSKASMLNKVFSDGFINKFKVSAYDANTTDNFIKAYLREMYSGQKSDPDCDLNEKHLSRIIDILFMGGTDTTSTTLLWALAYSVHYPECQKKAFDEINEVIGTDRRPSLNDKPNMSYLSAYILETQRLGSVVPFGGLRICSKTTYLAGYRIPEGATVVTNLDGVMKDEKVWKDTTTFRPERFLDQDGKVVIPEEFVPFSMGRRSCLGESLAKVELFLFLSSIMQRFEILPEDPNKLPVLESSEGATSVILPFRVRLKERQRK